MFLLSEILYVKVIGAVTKPKRIISSRHKIYISQKYLHLQLSLNEVNQVAWSL